MRLQGALIREQGTRFFIVVVKRSLIESPVRRSETIAWVERAVGVPTVLAAQDVDGTRQYVGRRDLVRFLASVPFHAIPWSKYEFA